MKKFRNISIFLAVLLMAGEVFRSWGDVGRWPPHHVYPRRFFRRHFHDIRSPQIYLRHTSTQSHICRRLGRRRGHALWQLFWETPGRRTDKLRQF